MDFLEFLKNYQAFNEEEEAERKEIVQFVQAFGDKAYDRDNLVGHFSSSAWIVNKDRSKVLMIYHNMYKTWAWVGGHADGDKDLLHVALKETQEETGLTNVKPVFLNCAILSAVSLSNESILNEGRDREKPLCSPSVCKYSINSPICG